MYEKQLAQILYEGDNPDTYAEDEARIRQRIADHMERRTTKPVRRDPKEGDVALEDYRLNEADKYRREQLADVVRAKIEDKRREASEDYWTIRRAEEDAKVDAEVEKMINEQRRQLPSVSSLILADDSAAPKPEKAAPKPGFDPLSQFKDSEAKEHRVKVESGMWNIAALCDPEVTSPSNTTKTNLGRPGPGPFPMGTR